MENMSTANLCDKYSTRSPVFPSIKGVGLLVSLLRTSWAEGLPSCSCSCFRGGNDNGSSKDMPVEYRMGSCALNSSMQLLQDIVAPAFSYLTQNRPATRASHSQYATAASAAQEQGVFVRHVEEYICHCGFSVFD